MARPDSTSARLRATELLRLLGQVERAPTAAVAAGLKALPEAAGEAAESLKADPVRTIKKATATTISVAASPFLYGLQQIGQRTTAGVAGAIEPPISYARSGFQGSPIDVLRQMGVGAARGVVNMEAPQGGDPARAVEDVYRRAGFKQGLYRNIPGARTRAEALMMLTGLQAKPLAQAAGGAEFLSGPGGAGLATEIAAGDVINQGARLGGALYRRSPIPEAVSRAGDVLRVTPGIRPLVDTFGEMGMGTVQRKIVDPTTGRVVAENAREGMRALMRERAGYRGALSYAWRNDIAGGRKAIESGVRASGASPLEMTPESWNELLMDRQKHLEVVRENARKQGAFTYQDYVTDGIITPEEGDWLQKVQDLLDESIPATRVGVGAKRASIYGAAEKAAGKAISSVSRMEKLAEQGREMLQHQRTTYPLDPQGNPLMNQGLAAQMGLGARDRLRRDLIKSITDADWAVRNFSRASRHQMKPVDFDRERLWTYTLEELLGITEQLTKPELKGLGMTAFDRSFVPIKSKVRFVIRQNHAERGYMARGFDKYGNEIYRGPVLQSPNEAIVEGRRHFPGENPEYVTQTDARWSSEKPVRGPKKSPLAALSLKGKEVGDYEKYFMNYLPRYGSEELQTITQQQRAYKKTGISTSLGGARISAPTTTQEEARQLIRDRYIRQSKAMSPTGTRTELKEPLQGLTEALETHIARNADAVSKTRFLGSVAENYGVYTDDAMRISELQQNGWKPLGALKGSTSGMDEYLKGKLLQTYVPESVFNGLSALDRVLQPVERAGFSKFFHKLLQAEKTYLTVPNPRFSWRNRTWEQMASYSRGNKNPANWIDAAKLLNGQYAGKQVPGFNLTGEELLRYLRREGVLDENIGLAADVAPMTSKAIRTRTNMQIAADKLRDPVDFMAKVNQEGEQLSRTAHYFWSVRDKHLDRVAARKEIATTIFDYQKDFYTLGEAQLKEWIPFYSWFRRIVPFTMRTAMERPGEFAKIGSIMTTINSMNGVSPEEMQYLGRTYLNNIGIVLPDQEHQPGGTKRVLNLQMGYSDPGQFMNLTPELSETTPGGTLTGAIRGVAGAFRPEVQLIPAFIYSASPSGEKFTGEIVKLPTVLLALPEPVRERLNIRVEDGIPMGPSTIIPLVRYLEGGWGEALGGSISTNPRAKAKFASWLTGFSIDPEVPMAENQMNMAKGKVAEFKGKVGVLQRGIRRISEARLREQIRRVNQADSLQTDSTQVGP